MTKLPLTPEQLLTTTRSVRKRLDLTETDAACTASLEGL
jgi:hypothetical protein